MRPRAIVITVLVWLAIAGVYAYYYAFDRVTSPDAVPGYETDWGFQLFAFSIVRLPLFVIALVLIIWAGRRFWPRKT
jgi:hypothetical protein